MKNFVSDWASSAPKVPKSYIFPPEKRPGDLIFPLENSIPVIDLESHDQSSTIKQIYQAGQDYGIFQVLIYINLDISLYFIILYFLLVTCYI